jgi:3-hydroxyisobutyrate dehydrogenase-like beta-hydroxyacid dehydrogenase
MTIKQIGLIGVGLMGHGIGRNILAKGYGLSVTAHKNRGPVESLIALGAAECASPAGLAAACDMVILCVTGTPQVEEAVYGINGLASAPRAGLIIADCSTAEPHSTVRIAADLAAKGVHFLDTPMTRTPKEAEAGRLGLMVGGAADIIVKIRPVLECFADTIIHAGPVGAGHQLKLVNNFLSISHAAVAAEAITAAAIAGVSMQALHDIVVSGGANSVMFERLIKVPLHNDDSAARFAIKNARKDMRYYTNMTEQLPVTSFMAEQVHQLLVLADNMGFGERYVPRLIDAMMQMNGVGPALPKASQD